MSGIVLYGRIIPSVFYIIHFPDLLKVIVEVIFSNYIKVTSPDAPKCVTSLFKIISFYKISVGMYQKEVVIAMVDCIVQDFIIITVIK